MTQVYFPDCDVWVCNIYKTNYKNTGLLFCGKLLTPWLNLKSTTVTVLPLPCPESLVKSLVQFNLQHQQNQWQCTCNETSVAKKCNLSWQASRNIVVLNLTFTLCSWSGWNRLCEPSEVAVNSKKQPGPAKLTILFSKEATRDSQCCDSNTGSSATAGCGTA